MPNWCTTHYIATGEPEELRAFAETLNTMPYHKNGFGKYWAGNFVYALGLDIEKTPCRGTFDPCFQTVACFCCNLPNEDDIFTVDADGKMRFSTTSAWSRMDAVERAIAKRWPSIRLSFSATDEFGNFHHTRNPQGFSELEKYETNEITFSKGELGEFISHLRGLCPGLHIPENEEGLASKEFEREFGKWRDADKSKRENIYYAIYEEV